MNFQRGLDPKRAMGIGVITWDNFQQGNILRNKKDLRLSTDGRFKRDGLKGNKWNTWMTGHKFYIKSIEKTTVRKIVIWNVKYFMVSIEDIQTKKFDFHSPLHTVTGPLEQFKKYFEIIQYTTYL